MKYKKLKAASFFAGVGGIDLGFFDLCDIVYANEFNEKSKMTYEQNFGTKIDLRDIKDVSADEISDFDVMLAGFPCQAFSIAGYRQGFDDEKGRGNLFFELERIFKIKQPRIIFLENVKNLVGHDKGNTFRVILNSLESSGYFVKYKVLNSMEYGNTPQNRERIYIVAFKNKEEYKNFDFPKPIELTKTINDIIDFEEKVDSKYYYTKDSFKQYEELEKNIISKNTVYQWRRKYVRENKSNVCPTLTANMGTGGHNVPLVLTKYGIRKLTPKECFLFQGFPEKFELPQSVANSHLYQQAGNSVSVTTIRHIADKIKEALI